MGSAGYIGCAGCAAGSGFAKPNRFGRSRTLQTTAIPRQRGEREVEAVEVVFKIENFRETGAGVEVFVPVAVGALVIDEPGGSTRDGGVMRIGGGEQGHHAPGGLRGGGFALAF